MLCRDSHRISITRQDSDDLDQCLYSVRAITTMFSTCFVILLLRSVKTKDPMGEFLWANGRTIAIASSLVFVHYFMIGNIDALHNSPPISSEILTKK